jgi:hypothetical protein
MGLFDFLYHRQPSNERACAEESEERRDQSSNDQADSLFLDEIGPGSYRVRFEKTPCEHSGCIAQAVTSCACCGMALCIFHAKPDDSSGVWRNYCFSCLSAL